MFHCNFQGNISIRVNGTTINGKPINNFLGVMFDSKLSWRDQVSNAISRTNVALHWVRKIKQYFTPIALGQLIPLNI